MCKGLTSIHKCVIHYITISNVLAGVLETVIEEEKSIYVNQSENILSNIKLYLETNGFKITKIH
jgi:hypothetical protein